MKPRLAFLCLGNSCRSIMAEALARHHYGSQLQAVSAGLSPLGWVAPATLAVLAELQVPTTGLRSKGLGEIDLPACQAVINLTDYDLGHRLPAGYAGRIWHRPIVDPFGFDLQHYRRTRDAIFALLQRELQLWLQG